MKIKKMLKGMLIMGIALSLVACGAGGEEPEMDNDNAGETVPENSDEEVTLEVYVPSGKNSDYLVESAKLYNEKNDANINLDIVDVDPTDGMVQKLTPQLVANETMPELVFIQDSHAGSIFGKFEDRFRSSEENGFVEEYGDDFYPAKMNMLANIAPSGKTYGFPNDWGNAIMYYNNVAFEEAGVDFDEDVDTWDDLIEAGKKLKEETGKKLMFMRNTGELDMVKYITEQQDVSFFDKNGDLNLLDDAVVKAYDIIEEIQDADLVAYGNSEDYTAIGQDAGIILAGGWYASYQGEDYPEGEGDWKIGALPNVSESEKSLSPMAGGSSYYVTKDSENPEEAMDFITFALTDEDALDEYLKVQGIPANTTAYDSEEANKESDYYGGQKITQTINEIGKNSVEGYVFPYSADLDNYIEQASYDIMENGVDVKEALKEQAEEFSVKYDIEIVE